MADGIAIAAADR
ncbi:Protein of unknown function, partial [Gryllus bimaculatus]